MALGILGRFKKRKSIWFKFLINQILLDVIIYWPVFQVFDVIIYWPVFKEYLLWEAVGYLYFNTWLLIIRCYVFERELLFV